MASVPEAVPQDRIRRYSNTAVALHWITVALVLTQVVLGFAFAEFMAKGPAKTEVFAWHKTLGALILILALIRLGYRLANPPPPFPPELPRWRRIAAVWNHRAFYFLLIVLPLTGLIAVSGTVAGRSYDAQRLGCAFRLFPELLARLARRAAISTWCSCLQQWRCCFLHVAAALQQQFFEHDRAAGRCCRSMRRVASRP